MNVSSMISFFAGSAWRRLLAVAAAAAILAQVVGGGTAGAQTSQPPERPTGLEATSASYSSVALHWGDPGDATIESYQVLRRFRDGSEYGDGLGAPVFVVIVDDTGSAANTYTDTSVTPGTRYVYRIKARNAQGLSETSSFANAETRTPTITVNDIPVVGVPLVATLSDPDGEITVTESKWGRGKNRHPDRPFDDISGATSTADSISASYTPVKGDVGKFLLVTFEFTGKSGIGTRTAKRVTGYVSDHAPSITFDGDPVVGVPLTATLKDFDGTIVVGISRWAWYYDPIGPFYTYNHTRKVFREGDPPWRSITYTPVESDIGMYLFAEFWYRDADHPDQLNFQALRFGAPIGPVERAPASSGNVENTVATGKPTISGTPAVGETLTADTGAIEDVNGLTNADFAFQWTRYDGATRTDITGATSATYTLQDDDVGQQVSVTVSFTDDDGFQESLTSDSVLVRAPSLLFGGFDTDTVPEEHSGEDAFTFQIHFSEEPELGYVAVRDHVLTVTNGDVTAVRRTTQGSNLRWEITVEPDGNDGVTVVLPPTTDCSDDGAVCTNSGTMLSSQSSITVPGPGTQSQQQQVENSPATGQPSITGTAEVGETLTVSTSQITDVNGVSNAAYAYQWSRYNGTTTTAISGATATSYTLQEADVDQHVSVTVSFTDDDGFQESLTSDSVLVRASNPLNGGFDNDTVPDEHDGEDAFTFQIHFSEEPSLGYLAVRDLVLTVTNGDVTAVRRTTQGSNLRWEITVQPDGNDDVTVQLPATTGCSDDGAVCTASGKMLSSQSSITVPGPETQSQQQQVENSPATGQPVITGTAQVGQVLTADTSGISDDDGLDNATFAYQWRVNDTGIQGATGSTYTVAEADQGHRIQVVVTFTDDADNEETLTSASTDAVIAASEPEPEPETPGTPTGLSATLNEDGSITLSWTAPAGDVDGYQVLRRRPQMGEDALQVYVGDTGSTATTYTDTSTPDDTRYVFRVKARNGDLIGEWSNFARIDK